MTGAGGYSGIKEATNHVQSQPDYPGPAEILVEVPNDDTVRVWTEALTGFEAGVKVSAREKSQLLDLLSLCRRSEADLVDHASELEVRSLDEFSPEAVLYMVCIRDLQQQIGATPNLNQHKFAVLRGNRYSSK